MFVNPFLYYLNHPAMQIDPLAGRMRPIAKQR
jgi:hypothetical protein